MTYEKPLPVVDTESRPFWDAAKEKRLVIPYCPDSGKYHFFPRALDPHSGSDNIQWREVSGRGTIHTYTVARRPAGPQFQADVPYVIAIVELDEGARMMTNIVGSDPAQIRIGQKVRVRFEEATAEITLPKFELADS